MKKKIILLLGLPGSGKGTQAIFLSKSLALPHISTGDIFRKIISTDNSKESKILQEYMNLGKLVPSELVNNIVKKFFFSDECVRGCILDGYPRSLDQAEYFVNNITEDINVIFFDIDPAIVAKRILGRMNCKICGRLYNNYFDKPEQEGVCDSCGSKEFIVRDDDHNENIILSRIEEYKKETLPLIKYYKNKGKFFTVNAGESKEQVVNALASIVKKI